MNHINDQKQLNCNIMAFSYLERVGIPGDIIDDIAKTAHAITLLPALSNIPSLFERFVANDHADDEDALTKLCKTYSRDDVMLFTEACDWYSIAIMAFDNSDHFIMWFLNKSHGTTYLIEGEYDYDFDIFTVDRFYHKDNFDAIPTTNPNEHAPLLYHGLNGTAFSTLATVMGEGSLRCTMSFQNEHRFKWSNPEMVCAWFERQTCSYQ